MNTDGLSPGRMSVDLSGGRITRLVATGSTCPITVSFWFLAVGDIRRGIACAGCAVEVSGWWGKEYLLRSRVPMVFRIHGSFF